MISTMARNLFPAEKAPTTVASKRRLVEVTFSAIHRTSQLLSFREDGVLLSHGIIVRH